MTLARLTALLHRIAVRLNLRPATDEHTCEACSLTADADEFHAYEAGEIDDPICDECLAVHRDAQAADESNRLAYYYR